jgi:integrase/recombinase XerC
MVRERVPDFIETIPAETTREKYTKFFRKLLAEYPDLTANNIREWLQEQRSSGVSENTLKTRMSAIRSFLKFLKTPAAAQTYQEIAEIAINVAKGNVYIPEDKVVEKAIKRAQDEPLHHALLLLLVDEGLRASEAIGIHAGDVDLHKHEVLVVRKGNKYQALPMSQRVEKALVELCTGKASGDLLLPFTYRTAHRIVKRYFPDIDQVHPHTLRHYAATKMLRQNHNLELTRKFLNHANIETTTIYTHLDNTDLAKAIRGY